MSGALLSFNVAAVALTLLGGGLPLIKNLFSRRWLWRLFSLRSGVLIAIAFVEILPHAWEHNAEAAGWGALAGFALLFSMESLAMSDSCPEYLENCSVHLLGWSALVALFIHSFIDGLNLTISFSAGALAGAVIGSSVVLHKLVDGFTLTSLLTQGGYSRRGALLALLLIALATPFGSALGLWQMRALPPALMSGLLGFAAGSFVYIGAADVLTRLHKTEDKGCLALFITGLIIIVALRAGH
ncbi:MAG: ZIP family metal transporter [Elusimicrobiota bacterium]